MRSAFFQVVCDDSGYNVKNVLFLDLRHRQFLTIWSVLMSSSSNFDPILGRLNWDIPAEVRLSEEDLRTAKQVDLDEFQREVLKSIRILQPIADERLANFTPMMGRSRIRVRQSIKELDDSVTLPSMQQEIASIEQLLKKNLSSATIKSVCELPPATSEKTIESEKNRISETVAQTVYETENIAKTVINWKEIRLSICPSIQGFSNDVFEVANTAISILAPLSIAGSLAISLQPMLWGWIILIISRVGLRQFCRGYE